MFKRVLYLFIGFIIAGCSDTLLPDVSRATQRPPAVDFPTSAVIKLTVSPTLSPTETTAPSETKPAPASTAVVVVTQPAGAPVLTQTSGSLTVQIYSDADVEVSEPKYLVSGKAPEGTVLSINDDIAVVDQSQAFSVWVPVDEGPNLIEIVASNDAGDEVNFIITVTYKTPQKCIFLEGGL